MLLSWLKTHQQLFKQNATHSTLIPKWVFKHWYAGAIYEVLSFLDQGLSHELVAINDHDPSTKETEAENVPIFLCKLNTKSTLVFMFNTE